MDERARSQLLEFVWQTRAEGTVYKAHDGRDIRIISKGDRESEGVFSGIAIETGGVIIRGDAVFGTGIYCTKYTVLHVTAVPSEYIRDQNGERIPQIIVPVPEEAANSLNSLIRDTSRMSCASHITALDTLRRTSLFEKLSLENLLRKSSDFVSVLDSTGGDWHQTMLVMLFRAMGGNQNREQYMQLASSVTYHTILRERSSTMLVESLLLGTAGMLEGGYYDDYIKSLKEHYAYLRNKHNITPMRAEEWVRGGYNPSGAVIVRLVQLAALLTDRDFLFDGIISCRSRNDIHNLFKAEASEYWTTHYRPDKRASAIPKRLGETKCDLLGINLVIPMIFTYGSLTGKEELKETAISMYELIPAESNSVLRPWTGAGVPLTNAQDSQAMLQLNKTYCTPQRCTACPIGRVMIGKRVSASDGSA